MGLFKRTKKEDRIVGQTGYTMRELEEQERLSAERIAVAERAVIQVEEAANEKRRRDQANRQRQLDSAAREQAQQDQMDREEQRRRKKLPGK
jgi:hypothetical protein